ncbi:MAG: hypothetical protein OHK0028_08870 [Deltaproteobacteria bacterium]
MMEGSVADRWLVLAAREEAILEELVGILQDDQRAVAAARAEAIEENVRRKDALIGAMRLLEESRGSFLSSVPEASIGFDALAPLLPLSRRASAEAALARLRSLRGAVVELNELSCRIMIHGLFLVRSTLGAMTGGLAGAGYGGTGDLLPRSSTGRIVRRDV